MNWKKWLGYNLYKKLWSLIGGRPWTFISRDVWHKLEIVPIMVFLHCGFFHGYFWAKYEISLWWLIPLEVVSILWYVLGHFFWGKEYIPDQKGK